MCIACFVHKTKEYINETSLPPTQTILPIDGHYTGRSHCNLSQLHTNLDPQNVQNKLFQLDFRPDNMTTTTYIQLELYWQPCSFKIQSTFRVSIVTDHLESSFREHNYTASWVFFFFKIKMYFVKY